MNHDVTKTENIMVRTTPKRKAIYVEAAAAEGVRVTEWLRRLADRRVEERQAHLASAGSAK